MVLVWSWNIGGVSENGDVCEELRKRMIDVCCLQEVKLRGQGASMLGVKGRKGSNGGLKKEMVLVVWELW